MMMMMHISGGREYLQSMDYKREPQSKHPDGSKPRETARSVPEEVLLSLSQIQNYLGACSSPNSPYCHTGTYHAKATLRTRDAQETLGLRGTRGRDDTQRPVLRGVLVSLSLCVYPRVVLLLLLVLFVWCCCCCCLVLCCCCCKQLLL